MLRHMSSVHKSRMDDEDYGSHDEGSNEESTDVDSNDSLSDTGSDSSNVESEDKEYWRAILKEAAEHIEFSKPEHLLDEPRLSSLVDEMRKVVEGRVQFAKHMKKENEVYGRIMRAKKRYKDESDEIAAQTSWNDKRYVLKELIADNLDVLRLDNEGESDEDEHEDFTDEDDDS